MARSRIPTLDEAPVTEATCDAPPEVVARLRSFIDRAQWTYAKTMPDQPHEYAVRAKCVKDGITEDEFEQVVQMIRTHGYRRRRGKSYYTYVNVDGRRYWTMGWPVNQTTIINRAK
jgi:hypothetical protein